MSLAGAVGGHSVVAKLLVEFGTEEQRQEYLPVMSTGAVRAAMALTEPGGGSDLQALTTTARRDGDEYVVNGTKTWITNARRAGVIARSEDHTSELQSPCNLVCRLLLEKQTKPPPSP